MGVLPAFAVPLKHLGPAERSRAFDLAYGDPLWIGLKMKRIIIRRNKRAEDRKEQQKQLIRAYCYSWL